MLSVRLLKAKSLLGIESMPAPGHLFLRSQPPDCAQRETGPWLARALASVNGWRKHAKILAADSANSQPYTLVSSSRPMQQSTLDACPAHTCLRAMLRTEAGQNGPIGQRNAVQRRGAARANLWHAKLAGEAASWREAAHGGCAGGVQARIAREALPCKRSRCEDGTAAAEALQRGRASQYTCLSRLNCSS